MKIVAPWYGPAMERYRPTAEKWLTWTRDHSFGADVAIITDRPEKVLGIDCLAFDTAFLHDCIRPKYPFDVKPAVTLAALAAFPADEDILMIDLDATILRDPRPVLAKFAGVPIAMTTDSGCILYDVGAFMTGEWSDVLKRSGGVMWFAASPRRRDLASMYRTAWHELEPVVPWTPPVTYVLEQYVWSLVAHRLKCPLLPSCINWSTRLLGSSPTVIIDHDYGHQKWNGQREPGNPG
jgi:hypothetical protein